MVDRVDRDFKGVWIPKEIWLDEDLTIAEKALFAEIDSLDGDNGCYASNEYLAKFCGMSPSFVSKAISKLKSKGLVRSESFDGRTRVLRVVKFTMQTSKIYESDYDKNCVSSIIYKIEDKYSIERQAEPAHSSKHHRNFREKYEPLEDKLSSEEEIARQTKERKKQSEYDKCLAHIDSLEYSDEVKDLLRQFFMTSYNRNISESIKNCKQLQSRLKKLAKLADNDSDRIKIIQQSIDNEWNSFWELQVTSAKKSKSYEGVSSKVKSDLSSEERKRLMEEKMQLVAEGKVKVY